MKVKQRIKKKNTKKIILILLIILLLCVIIFFIPRKDKNNILNELGYSNIAIKQMEKYNISNYIGDKNEYSKTLEKALINNEFIKDNINLYYSLEYQNYPEFISNINSLTHIGYNNNQINLIFKYLENSEIKALTQKPVINEIEKYIVFDYFKINNVERYINYLSKNNHLSHEDIITYVNIGLDYQFYQNIKTLTNLDDTTILVNKYRKLPSNFVPKNLVVINAQYTDIELLIALVANEAFERMANESKKHNLEIKVASAYRSYERQSILYNNYVKRDGIKKADTYSARPGHSEHQTGLAIDITGGDYHFTDFHLSKEFIWVKDNMHKYGFILRFPKNKEDITGYQYESWHIRYVGIDIATYIYENNITYDEYYIKFLEK